MVFDGRALAKEIEKELIESGKLKGKSLLVLSCEAGSRFAGQSRESSYVKLKRKAGERMGVNVSVQISETSDQLKKDLLAMRASIFSGVLVQLPIVGASKEETEAVLNLIPPEKDVDGLNSASSYQPAVVRAVEKIMDLIKVTPLNSLAVVGARGMVGKRLVASLQLSGFSSIGQFDLGDDLNKLKDYWVVISATGQAGLIKPAMLREGVVAIDLGYPVGDFDATVVEKVSFITPVPGGVGPVTVACLFENLAGV